MKEVSKDGRDPFPGNLVTDLVPASKLVRLDESSNATWASVSNMFHHNSHKFRLFLLACGRGVLVEAHEDDFSQL